MNLHLIRRIYSWILAIARIVVVIIVILAVYSVATQRIMVENVGNPYIEMEGINVTVKIPITLKNYGYYDIRDISISYDIKNESVHLLSYGEIVGDIKKDSIETLIIPIKVDLKKLYELEYPSFYHFFNNDTFHLNLTLSLKYMLGLVTLRVNFDQDVDWTPPIKDANIYPVHSYSMDSQGIHFKLPYMIKTADYLSGMGQADGVVEGSEGEIGNFTTEFSLGTTYYGNISSLINYENAKDLVIHSQWLYFVGNVAFLGLRLPINETYYWGAPLDNLSYEILSNNTIHYSFTDNSPSSLNLYINRTYYYQGNIVKHETTHLYVATGEYVDRYEDLNITQPVDQVLLSFYDSNSGVYYKEVISL